MLQIQYYNKGLSKKQIEQIIKNYNLKYTTLTNEINLKLNSIIKTVLSDITPFLENIEYLSKQAKELKEIENTKNRIDTLEAKLKEKALLEKELQNNITYLKQEINELKEREKEYERNIRAKDDIINNLEKEKINKKKKKMLNYSGSNKHLTSSSMENLEINYEQKSEILDEEEIKQKNKNLIKNSKYMMNLKEITRNLNIYHDHTLLTRNNKNINKFISSATQKEETKYNKYNKNKKRNVCSTNKKSMKKNQDMRLSSEIKKVSKFNFNKDEEESDKENRINISQDDKSSIVFDEEIDEEIKELEIDEQNILNLINKINNFEK